MSRHQTAIAPEILKEYSATRGAADRTVLCHAPFVSLNFDQFGRVTACCYNRLFVLGRYPKQTLHEIWTGAASQSLREAFQESRDIPGCALCFHALESRNFSGALMRNFDRYSERATYHADVDVAAPRVLEFEISNTCNLECVMCGGQWSSAIRANREKLPPLRSPYDLRFVEQLEEFLPSIVEAKFLGGEPFLIRRYYDLWERIRQLNPEMRLSITTNATFVPQRARELLEGLRANIVVSLDAATPATYESIRVNARYDRVLDNIEYLLSYCQRRGTELSVAVCPMTHNWRELHLLLEFCEVRQIGLYFNLVLRPAESTLASFSEDELGGVITYLEQSRPAGDAPWTTRNRAQLDGLIHQLQAWREEKRSFARRSADVARNLREFTRSSLVSPEAEGLPGHVDRLLDTVAFASRQGSERTHAAHEDLGTLLVPTELAAWDPNEYCDVTGLVLASYALGRFIDASAGNRPPVHELVAEYRMIEAYLDEASLKPTARFARVQRFASWIRSQILKGGMSAVLTEVRSLRAPAGLLAMFEKEVREDVVERLPLQMQKLRERGLRDAECSQVEGYFHRIVDAKFKVSPVPAVDDQPERDAFLPGTISISSVAELRMVFESIYLFQMCFVTWSDNEWFRQRIDACCEAVTASGRFDEATEFIQRSGVHRMWEYLANTPDQDLAWTKWTT